jgi:hypothetical protein
VSLPWALDVMRMLELCRSSSEQQRTLAWPAK